LAGLKSPPGAPHNVAKTFGPPSGKSFPANSSYVPRISHSSQRFSHVLEQQHQLKWVNWGGIEIEIFIEPSGGIVDSMDHYGPDADNLRRLLYSRECIEQQGLTEPFSLLVNVDCEASQKNDADR
jgi:hypothetical protein